MYPSRQRRKHVAVSWHVFRLILLCILLFIIGKYSLSVMSKSAVHTPIPLITSAPSTTPLPTRPPVSSGLSQVVQAALSGTDGKYGIVVDNLQTGETYYQNEHQSFVAGSLYKLWVMGAVYDQIAAGKLQESDVLSATVTDLNTAFNIDPDQAEQTTGTITYSVKDALYQMITISDNYAALLLTQKIGLSSVAAFLHKNGLSESAVGIHGENPTTTASDVALYFEKLYKGQLGTPDATDEMLTLLKQQKLNEKIPLEIPDDVDIAHKTGEIDDLSHDAGIIYIPNNDTVLVMLTQTSDTDAANQRIADVAQAVYTYFTK